MTLKILKDVEEKMEMAVLRLEEDISKIRTGRAQSSLVENIMVSYYGSQVSIKELASIAIPEPTLIQLSPFDKNSIGDIENAIRNSDLGLSPTNDGNFVRIVLPALTEERRVELSKKVKSIGEEAKVALRNIRKDAWSEVRAEERAGAATEDDKYQVEKGLNDLIEQMNKKVDDLIKSKEKEIMKL